MHGKRNSGRFSGSTLAGAGLVLMVVTTAGCAQAPVRSTVDAYGEALPTPAQPLCFVRDGIPLRERPIADACREAARDRGIQTAEPSAQGCLYVVARSDLQGGTREITTGPRVGPSLGLYGRRGLGGMGMGMGIGSGSTEVRDFAEREISITVYRDRELKDPGHTIDVRSAGKESSVAAVAYEMCEAAFREYPKNLRGQIYKTKRREEAN